MAYFPAYLNLSNQNALIIGGGKVAARKAASLLSFKARVQAAALSFDAAFDTLPQVQRIYSAWTPALLEGVFLVVAATDDEIVNRSVSEECAKRSILCNVVDNKELSSFIFPAIVREGDLVIGISTEGASPSAAVYLKEKIASMLPQNFDAILGWLSSIRPAIIETVPAESARSKIFHEAFAQAMEKGGPLDEQQFKNLVGRYAR